MKIKEYRKVIMLMAILVSAVLLLARFTAMKSVGMAMQLSSLKKELENQACKVDGNRSMDTMHGIHDGTPDGHDIIQVLLGRIRKHGCTVISVKPEIVINHEKYGLNRISVSFTGNFHNQILVLDGICRALSSGQAMSECSFMVMSDSSEKSIVCSFTLNYITKHHGEKQQI